jgi:hypothetical protein
MILLLAYLACQFGCLALSMSIKRHSKLLFKGRQLSMLYRRLFLTAGYLLQLAAIYLSNLTDTLGIALTTYGGLLTLAIIITALVYSRLSRAGSVFGLAKQ